MQTPAPFEYERATSVEGVIATLERLGPRGVGAFAPCEGPCGTWSWCRYGAAVLCLPCALAWSEPDISV